MIKLKYVLLTGSLLLSTTSHAEDCEALRISAQSRVVSITALQSAVANYENLIKEFEAGYTGNADEEDAWYDDYVDAHVELHDLKQRLMATEDSATMIKIRRQRHCGLPRTYHIPKRYNKKV